jgi:hypothetical protein
LKAFAKVSRLPEFEKDLKKLSKRFKTLEDDLRIFIDTQLNLFNKLGIDNGGIFQIPGLHIEASKFYKAKKFACRFLKGAGAHSGIRVIYTYFEEEDRLELIEIYYKGDKENEDR